MTKICFNAKQLDVASLVKRAKREATEIHSKESTRRNRSLEQVIESCLYGHAAELYLIENCGFKDDDRPYKDLYNESGESVEVKVTQGTYYVPYVLHRAEEAKKMPWRKFSDILYIFIGNKETLDYELEGIYKWSTERNRFTKTRN